MKEDIFILCLFIVLVKVLFINQFPTFKSYTDNQETELSHDVTFSKNRNILKADIDIRKV